MLYINTYRWISQGFVDGQALAGKRSMVQGYTLGLEKGLQISLEIGNVLSLSRHVKANHQAQKLAELESSRIEELEYLCGLVPRTNDQHVDIEDMVKRIRSIFQIVRSHLNKNAGVKVSARQEFEGGLF